MLYLISYDVVEDKARGRVHEILKGFGRRVQYSVFECEISEAEVREITARVGFEVDGDTDSCRLYRLCGGCGESVQVIGKGDRYREPDVTIV